MVHEHVTPRSSILILILAFAVIASPLRGLVHAQAPEDGSGHAHHHSHDGWYDSHDHQHHHDGEDEDDPPCESDHHSTLDDTPEVLKIAWTAPRRGEVPMAAPAHGMVVLAAPGHGDWLRFRHAKPPRWLPPLRYSHTDRLRTVILQV